MIRERLREAGALFAEGREEEGRSRLPEASRGPRGPGAK